MHLGLVQRGHTALRDHRLDFGLQHHAKLLERLLHIQTHKRLGKCIVYQDLERLTEAIIQHILMHQATIRLGALLSHANLQGGQRPAGGATAGCGHVHPCPDHAI